MSGDPHARPVRDGLLVLLGAALLAFQVVVKVFLEMDLTQG